ASLALLVRAGTAWIYLAVLGAALIWVAARGSQDWARLSLLVLASDMALSVYTRSDYLFVKEATVDGSTFPSDVQAIALNLGLTYWFWGALIAALSALLLWFGLKPYWRG
ncbi:MAG: M50 family metallopeptidase, partial [Candidatus Eremiobacterota bacterium]